MEFRMLLNTLVFAIFISNFRATNADQCSNLQSISLTSFCDKECTSRLCVVYPEASIDKCTSAEFSKCNSFQEKCLVQCISTNETSIEIRFGGTKSFDTTPTAPIEHIDEIYLPPEVQSLKLSSLDSVMKDIKGSDIEMLSLNNGLQDLVIHSLNIGLHAGSLPVNLKSLTVVNANLKSLPKDVPSMFVLETLIMDNNPFEQFPMRVFELHSLKQLSMKNTGFKWPVLSKEEIQFLQELEVFDTPPFSRANCPPGSKKVAITANLIVCFEDEEDEADSSKSDGFHPNPQPPPESSTDFLSTIIMTSIGTFIVVILAGVVFIFVKRNIRTDGTDQTSTFSASPNRIIETSFNPMFATKSSADKPTKPRSKHLTNSFATDSTSSSQSCANSFVQPFHYSPDDSTIFTEHEGLLELRINFDDIKYIKEIARGAFGAVWKGLYKHRIVAVKTLLPERSTHSLEDAQSFIPEIVMMGNFHHPRIVQFIGVAWTNPSNISAVTEFMDNGDLRAVLDANRTSKDSDSPSHSLSWKSCKISIAISIAEALQYLHSHNPPFIHRDLKSKNVLMDSSMGAKVADFGLSRTTTDQTSLMTVGIGTIRWMSPEMVVGDSYSEKVDIYSFGIILAELSTHRIPFDDKKTDSGETFGNGRILNGIATGTLKPTFHPSCPPTIEKLAMECLSFDPSERPTAHQILHRIHRVVKKELEALDS